MIVDIKKSSIEVHDLTVSYNKKPVLWNIDFSLPKGKVIGIVGPNGAGKSTLLKSIMGLIPKDSGYIKILDKSLEEVRKEVGYVPQRASLDWHFPVSAFDVVLMGRYGHLKIFENPKKEDKDIAMDCLKQVEMTQYANRQISELSGGQQQRVIIARSLAQKANIYLMDEPFVGVDIKTETLIMDILKNLTKEGKTVLVVHHDLQSIEKYFDWLVLLNLRLIASAPVKDVLQKNLIDEAYGAKLSILSDLGNTLEKESLDPRDRFVK